MVVYTDQNQVNKHNNGFTKTVAMISRYPFSVVKVNTGV